jgi:hypothetical protein
VGRPDEARAVRPRGVVRRGLGGESVRGHRVGECRPMRRLGSGKRGLVCVPARWGERAGRAQAGRAQRQGTGAG